MTDLVYMTAKELSLHLGISKDSIDEWFLRGYINGFSFPGIRCRVYKISEVVDRFTYNAAFEQYVDVKYNCEICGGEFTTRRLMVISQKRLDSNKPFNIDRKFCNDCKKGSNTNRKHTEEEKKRISERMKDWWDNISDEKREEMSNKSSVKKLEFWKRNPELRFSIGEKVKRFWEENPKAKDGLKLSFKEAWNTYLLGD